VAPVLYEIELDGDIVEQRWKVVAPLGRLLRRIEAWDDQLRDAYTRICADRAHDLTGNRLIVPGRPPLLVWPNCRSNWSSRRPPIGYGR
jgi:hypothetical protein